MLYKIILNHLELKQIEIDNTIPKFKVEQKHIQNLKTLTDRNMLLEHLPKHGIVAELGIDSGEFSKLILEENSPHKLHLIDSWESQRYHRELRNIVEDKFQNQIEQGIVEINTGLSTVVGKNFPEEYFDWIYIDTDHSYETTRAELELYSKKIKADGIIAGHDFVTANWKRMVRYGVIEAVYEFCVKNDWEIIFLTMENQEHPSFAIQRMARK